MGRVYRAFDERLHRRVALKQIRPDVEHKAGGRERLLQEARAAARLNHPALVHVHDILETPECDWIVMELVEGEPLARLLEAGPLDAGRSLKLAQEIASGLAAAHAAGIVHGDIKAENVVVTSETPARAKILDFGLAALTEAGDDPTLPGDNHIQGTPRAMSPEQAQGRELGPPSDLFAFGVLLYEMVTGISPFRASGTAETLARICNLRQAPVLDHVPTLPPELSELIDRLLAKDPAARPRDADEVLKALDRIAETLEPVAETDAPQETAAEIEVSPPECEKPQVRGERRRVTLMCCDLTTAGEALDFDLLIERLPDFQTVVAEAVERFGGSLWDVQGHRLIATFGHPLAHEDDPRRAILTGLEIVSRVAHPARVGIHEGPAVLLALPGQPERLILGKTLDLAAGILEQAAPGSVLVSASTRDLTPGFPTTNGPEPLPDPGLPVHRIVAAGNVHQRTGRGGPEPLVGRQSDLELLKSRFQLAREGTGQGVLLVGEAGIGKSRLLRALHDDLVKSTSTGTAPWWHTAQGLPYTRNLVLYPVSGLLRQLLGLAEDAAPEAQLTRLQSVLREHDFPLSETVPLLSPLLTSPLPGWQAPDHVRQRELLEALPALAFEMTERREPQHLPLTLVFEDLQWSDHVTLDLAERLLELGTATPLLILLTCRPGFRALWTPRVPLSELRLNPLTDEEIHALIEAWTGDGEMDPRVREQIAARSDGVPLYAEELVRAAITEAEAVAPPKVPVRLHGVLSSRLDRLGAAREVAQVAAALGHELTFRQLAEVVTLDKETLIYEVGRLLDAGILRGRGTPPDATYRFHQALLRDAALTSLLPEYVEQLRTWLSGDEEIL